MKISPVLLEVKLKPAQNILRSKMITGSNPEVWVISLEQVLEGLNLDGIHSP